MRVLGEKLEDLVYLVLKTTGQHLVGLVETEDLDVVGAESTAVDHVEHTTRGADDDLDALLELGHVLTDVSAADASVALDVHVVAEGDDDLLDLLRELAGRGKDQRLSALDIRVDALEDGDGKGRGLASTGLGLRDDVVSLDNRDDSTLLDSRGALETRITVNTCGRQ